MKMLNSTIRNWTFRSLAVLMLVWISPLDAAPPAVVQTQSGAARLPVAAAPEEEIREGGTARLSMTGETFEVDLPELTGIYRWGAERQTEIGLGFSLFEIESVRLHWAGAINTGMVDCWGLVTQGFGGIFYAQFAKSGAYVSRQIIDSCLDCWIPFDSTPSFSLPPDETSDSLLDGAATLQVSFPYIFQECWMLIEPRGRLDSVTLVIEARRMHDFDADGVVNLNDLPPFEGCLSGPHSGVTSECQIFDADRDDHVDLIDMADFQICFTDGGTGPVCGNGEIEQGEECDDGNTTTGDGCDAKCQFEGGLERPVNDDCANAQVVSDGFTDFSNVDATTDGPDEPTVCNFFGDSHIRSDVWFCYTATCDGEAVASLCGSQYDTKMAVYAGCECPAQAAPLGCSDDDCGGGAFDSRVVFQATAGQSYLIRVGGFFDPAQGAAEGDGTLTIRCGETVCGEGQGDCLTDNGTPGCDDVECCNTMCEVDAFCCDVEWDDFCAQEAAGLCSEDGFDTCNPDAGDCMADAGNGTPGCENVDCCNTVCALDPFCCIDTWDDICADEALDNCVMLETCGPDAGSCFFENASPGCNQVDCCEIVCPDDPFCCNTEWDQQCAERAVTECR